MVSWEAHKSRDKGAVRIRSDWFAVSDENVVESEAGSLIMPLLNEAGQTNATETLEQRFRRLDAVWRKETAFQSSSTKIKNHPAFREVIGLGDAVIPLLLRDLQASPSLWVWALPEIVGADPTSPQDAGNIVKMTEAWLRWAKEHGRSW